MLYTDHFLSSKRLKGDIAADEFIAKNFVESDSKLALYKWLKQLDDNSALDRIPDLYRKETFINSACNLPLWADRKLMKKVLHFL